MTGIEIENELKSKVPETALHCIECDVVTGDTSSSLWEMITRQCSELHRTVKMEDISGLPAIKASRAAYKACGKDPARYRLSAEALLRRAVKGEELYRIGNVVDLLNLVSLSTGFSIGGYDAEKISGPVRMGIGKANEPYSGIGRGVLNIEGLPVFRDDLGAFGSPTSDSERTCVDRKTSRFLMVIIDFGSPALAENARHLSVQLLKTFASADHMEINTIGL